MSRKWLPSETCAPTPSIPWNWLRPTCQMKSVGWMQSKVCFFVLCWRKISLKVSTKMHWDYGCSPQTCMCTYTMCGNFCLKFMHTKICSSYELMKSISQCVFFMVWLCFFFIRLQVRFAHCQPIPSGKSKKRRRSYQASSERHSVHPESTQTRLFIQCIIDVFLVSFAWHFPISIHCVERDKTSAADSSMELRFQQKLRSIYRKHFVVQISMGTTPFTCVDCSNQKENISTLYQCFPIKWLSDRSPRDRMKESKTEHISACFLRSSTKATAPPPKKNTVERLKREPFLWNSICFSPRHPHSMLNVL